MRYQSLAIPEVKLLIPTRHCDERGYFMETLRQDEFERHCGFYSLVQDNHSRSWQGTLRGLHYQQERPQGKLVRAVRGRVFDVAVDVRPDSASYGQWVGQLLSEENDHQMWIPPGFAHGFYVLSEVADLLYRCSDYYYPAGERTLRWDSPALAIDWPLLAGVALSLSAKDARAPYFCRPELG
ncbi:dTDP-4-dehydrorhamnose 3,5-epimerase [Aeromonas veronii]|uniref:dTDP-4-dehydrorhamnose 3,5-epimerase n=1 Tax=Aeromonas veronii TaxID=654 RepID=A0AAW5MLM4_AERVE|nr:dTDP-4-dehydrorhamnose 3,5-epimerase [Aeromonas veronii]MCR4451156.1 dTDP-4-dehydrorhamnose 3,5-epimerase [Aeromonas veronii]